MFYSIDKDLHSPHEGAVAAEPTDEDENLGNICSSSTEASNFVHSRSKKSLFYHGFIETMNEKLLF